MDNYFNYLPSNLDTNIVRMYEIMDVDSGLDYKISNWTIFSMKKAHHIYTQNCLDGNSNKYEIGINNKETIKLLNNINTGMLEYYNIKKKKVYKVLDFKDWFYSLK